MPEPLTTGSPIPDVKELAGVDGKRYSFDDFSDKNIVVVVFSCNHCPYVQAYEDRMIAFQRDYAGKGVQLVAINSNDERNYPEDSFERMVSRAKKKGFNFPYLRDDEQRAADLFGATHTPEFFVFDGSPRRLLRYHGRMDDNHADPSSARQKYVEDAVEAILTGKEVTVPEVHSLGCTIKWKF
ncbi:MAG: thioredoxin family protein [Ignavibacteria bacterium]|nr:thioredoxin family protein [Ignavibacteria bacterium]